MFFCLVPSPEGTASVCGALAVLGLLALVAAGFTVGVVRRSWTMLVGTAAVGGVFQLAHFAEHAAQLGYWGRSPRQPALDDALGARVGARLESAGGPPD